VSLFFSFSVCVCIVFCGGMFIHSLCKNSQYSEEQGFHYEVYEPNVRKASRPRSYGANYNVYVQEAEYQADYVYAHPTNKKVTNQPE
jgi:hypothetical protein